MTISPLALRCSSTSQLALELSHSAACLDGRLACYQTLEIAVMIVILVKHKRDFRRSRYFTQYVFFCFFSGARVSV